jgi:hypothetical protein
MKEKHGLFGKRVTFSADRDHDPAAIATKVRMRQRLLEELGGPGHVDVFDGFAGAGIVWDRCYREVRSYVACDTRWFRDERLAYVCKSERLLRALDLQGFNLFDFDAYGSPWHQVAIVAARRNLSAGEKVAFALTDGSPMAMRFGHMIQYLHILAGVSGHMQIAARTIGVLHVHAIRNVARMMGGVADLVLRARNPKGAQCTYLGIVVRGVR